MVMASSPVVDEPMDAIVNTEDVNVRQTLNSPTVNPKQENGPWFLRNNPLILKKWNLDVNLLKEDVGNILVWVKLHGVPLTAFSEDGLGAIATNLGTSLMLDSYTSNMCIQSWGFYTCNVRVEYEWKPPRCACCEVFGHVLDKFPNNIDSDVLKNMKKPSQTLRDVLVGPKVGFKPVKQEYRQVGRKTNVNTNGNMKKDVELIIEVSNSNLFDVLNSVKNDVYLGTNGGSSNLTSRNANISGFLSGSVESSSTSNTFMVEKIDKMERLIIEGYPLWTMRDSYGNNSLLEQWKESYMNGDYDFDPYDDDMYEGQDIPDKIQDICDNFDITVRGRKKK
nr:hypothetical protein [Tanacetum cinerariifolium]